ncbi:MAG: CHAD domain-containing protein [Henriciella sp.]|uniref:CHAD domain-containing protein n=1 Tax=Henriciella sp. TaxID=1968823 RepID=UPI0032ECB30C
MAYSFKLTDQGIDVGLRRIAVSQLETGLAELRDEELSQAERVHQARKRCKKLRGLLRLVRGSFSGYSEENTAFRDAARTLSSIRDATAVLESLEEVEAHFSDELKKAALKPLRAALEKRRDNLDESEVEERLADMRLVFREALDRVEDWSLDAKGADAFAPGAAKTYKRAQKAMAAARKSGKAEDFHEWRKRVKYHWYHLRLLKRIWPPVMKGYVDQADTLSDELGEHHDLAVLSATAADLLGANSDTAELIDGLATARQTSIEETCLARGEKLFTDSPDELAERWATWWDTAFKAE